MAFAAFGHHLAAGSEQVVVRDAGGPVLDLDDENAVVRIEDVPTCRDPPPRLVVLEPNEPVETVTIDDLSVGCTPGPLLQVVHDPATL